MVDASRKQYFHIVDVCGVPLSWQLSSCLVLVLLFIGARNETSKITPSGLGILYYSNLIKGLQVFFQRIGYGVVLEARNLSLLWHASTINHLHLASFFSIRTESCSLEMSSPVVLYNKPCRAGIATRLGAGRCGVHIPAVERDFNFFPKCLFQLWGPAQSPVP